MTQKIAFQNTDGSIGVVHIADSSIPMADHINMSVPVKVLKAGMVVHGVGVPFAVEIGDQLDARLAAANELSCEQVSYRIVDEADVPTCRLFRAAWKFGEAGIAEDTEVAKQVAHDLRRAAREEEFAPLDKAVVIATANPEALAEAEAERQQVRDRYAVIQDDLEACADCQELRVKLQEHGIV